MKHEDKSYYHIFIGYIFITNMFDFVSTYLVLQAGGIELNYIFSFINNNTLIGWVVLFLAKIMISIIICWIYTIGWKHDKIITTSIMYTAATMLFMAGVHNIIVLRHMI